MSPPHHQVKELAERLCGRHLVFSRTFPFVRAERRFLTVRLDLHNKCNIRCRMCYFALDEIWNAPRVELSDTVIARLEAQVWPLTRELWLSCATEPLLGHGLERVLPRAKAAGIPQIQLVTNALALGEAKARLLIDGGLDRLSVSLDGASAATYEQVRTHSNFERVVENVRRLQSLKAAAGRATPALTVRAVMMLHNVPEWAAIVRLAAELGADRVVLQPQTYYTEFGAQDRLWDHPAAVNAALAEAAAAARECGLALEAPAGFGSAPKPPAAAGPAPACAHCVNPWIQLMVYPDGRVTPCFQLFGAREFGSLEQQSFRQIYYGRPFRALREELRSGRRCDICRSCAAGTLERLDEDAAAKLQRPIFPG